MAKQTIRIKTTTRTKNTTVTHSKPGNGKIGKSSKGNPYRCDRCGRYMNKPGGSK